MTSDAVDSLQEIVRRWSGGSVTRIRVGGQIAVPAHAHEQQHLCVVVAGAFEERSITPTLCESGSTRLSPANDLLEMEILDAPFECIVIEMSATLRGNSARSDATLFARTYGNSNAMLAKAKELSAVMDRSDALARLTAHQLSAELIAASLRSASHADESSVPSWLVDVRLTLDREYQQPIQLRRLASLAGVHPVHVSRAFRTHFGRTLSQYAMEQRLSAAIRQLGAHDRSISCIAADCGFSDHAHLTREMRAWVGYTPSALRGLRSNHENTVAQRSSA
ncbi:MAG: AraC family transcriptional regulator [Gemmatimonas sp.]